MNPKIRKLINKIMVEGKTKPGLFKKSKDFEVHIYYTPIKKKIFNITISGIDDNELNLPFKVGDDLSIVTKWIDDNNYVVKLHRIL
jgi:hypothetical protein